MTKGEKIRCAREAMAITQAQLAKKAGIHRMTLSLIERNKTNMRLDTFENLLKALGLKSSEELEAF